MGQAVENRPTFLETHPEYLRLKNPNLSIPEKRSLLSHLKNRHILAHLREADDSGLIFVIPRAVYEKVFPNRRIPVQDIFVRKKTGRSRILHVAAIGDYERIEEAYRRSLGL